MTITEYDKTVIDVVNDYNNGRLTTDKLLMTLFALGRLISGLSADPSCGPDNRTA